MNNSITNDDLAEVIHSMFNEGMVITDKYGDQYDGSKAGDISWIMYALHKEKPMGKPMEDLYEQFAEEWIGRKMREKVEEHVRRYPNFKYAVEYIEDMLTETPKTQAWQVYQPISKWSKSRRKTVSFARFAESQS